MWDASGVSLSSQWHQKDFTKYELQKKPTKNKQNKKTTMVECSAWLHRNGTIFMLTHFISFWQKAAKIISLHPYWKCVSKARPVILWGKKKEKKQGYGWQVALVFRKSLCFYSGRLLFWHRWTISRISCCSDFETGKCFAFHLCYTYFTWKTKKYSKKKSWRKIGTRQ